MNVLELAERNQQKAWEIIEDTHIIQIWEGIGAKVNLVGSLRTGLLMKHRDIDFHIYTSPLDLSASFRVMAELAENMSIKKIEYTNLLHTAEACIEWHAWYKDNGRRTLANGYDSYPRSSRYDGYLKGWPNYFCGIDR